MAKLVCFAFLFICISASLAHRGSSQSFLSYFVQLFVTPTSICANTTTQATYLTNTINLLNAFQQNTTYNAVLQSESINFVTFIRSPVNQALLYSNCTAFVTGVKSAKAADRTAERNRESVARDIYNRLRQVPRTATGSNGPNDLDSGEGCRRH
ncbi:hypothetical protein I4U23_001464 [Adineta vaga]|nr:hypothetical protein I4U23_001464 [Adineta vaga]